MDSELSSILDELPRLRSDGVTKLSLRILPGGGFELAVEMSPPVSDPVPLDGGATKSPDEPPDELTRIPRSPYAEHLDKKRAPSKAEDELRDRKSQHGF